VCVRTLVIIKTCRRLEGLLVVLCLSLSRNRLVQVVVQDLVFLSKLLVYICKPQPSLFGHQNNQHAHA
jgi:hypothetical protein